MTYWQSGAGFQLVSAASSPTHGTLWWSRQRRHLSKHHLPHLPHRPQALHLTLSLWGTNCYCCWMHESGLTLRNLNCWHWKTAGWHGTKTFTWRVCQQKFRGSTCPKTYQFPLCLQSFFLPLHTGHKVRYHHNSAWPFSYKGCNLHGLGCVRGMVLQKWQFMMIIMKERNKTSHWPLLDHMYISLFLKKRPSYRLAVKFP